MVFWGGDEATVVVNARVLCLNGGCVAEAAAVAETRRMWLVHT